MDLLEASERAFSSGARHPWETARVEVVRRLIERHVKLEPGTAVLDIGCGDGFVVGELARMFPDVSFYGIDTALTGDFIEGYRRNVGRPNVTLLSSLNEFTGRSERVALVLLMDVLEHIEHDRAFLMGQRNGSYTSRDTKFLITVPAFQALFSSPDVFLGHFRRYSNTTLDACIRSAGLEVLDIGYFFASLLPLRAIQVLRERARASAPEAPTTGLVSWRGGPLAATVLTRLLALDARIGLAARRIGLRVPGLSNYAICRKAA